MAAAARAVGRAARLALRAAQGWGRAASGQLTAAAGRHMATAALEAGSGKGASLPLAWLGAAAAAVWLPVQAAEAGNEVLDPGKQAPHSPSTLPSLSFVLIAARLCALPSSESPPRPTAPCLSTCLLAVRVYTTRMHHAWTRA